MSPKNRILGLERRILGAKQISFEYIANIRLAQTENRKKTHFLVRREIRGAVHLAMQCFKKTTTPLDSHSLGVYYYTKLQSVSWRCHDGTQQEDRCEDTPKGICTGVCQETFITT